MKQSKFILLLFLISFFIRAFIFQFYLSKNEKYWQIDSNTYHLIAQNIAQNCKISADGQNPSFYRLPGYSLFLAACYKIFGENKVLALWVQVLLASFIPILIFFLSLILFPANILLAQISSLYSCFQLGLVLYSGFFMTESLFIFFFLLFAILFFSFDKKKLFWAGIFLGLASLIRPVGHYLIFLSILILLINQDLFINKIKKIILIFLGWFIIIFPWLLRNYLLLGQIFFHTLPGGHFLYFSATRVCMIPNNCTYQESRQKIEQKVKESFDKHETKLGRKLNDIESCNIMQNLAIKIFKKYPIIALKHWFTDILRTSLSLYSSEIILLENKREHPNYFSEKHNIWCMFKRYLLPQTDNIFLKIIIYLEIILFVFILFGFFMCLIKFNFVQNFILLKILLFILLFLFTGLSGGFSRMRLPIEVFLIILSFKWWLSWFFQSKIIKNF
ncbi:glycosyltransferase family 39 protein [Candidatus Babeliales bacterium]|nr:glycosyltransferase family 39 protein [Candidatus Babeliales bacterium]